MKTDVSDYARVGLLDGKKGRVHLHRLVANDLKGVPFDLDVRVAAEIELGSENHQVLLVEPLGIQPVVSIEVIDHEPDDKRDWSEHNYVLAPIGNRTMTMSGVAVLNTRRAAKMVQLNVDHPDIEEFIWCKTKEEKKAHVLLAAGYSGGIDGEAYGSVFYQNANNSVRVTDEFMRKIGSSNPIFQTRAVTTDVPISTLNADNLFDQICEAAWQCADPGLQFDTTINAWHTCPNSGRINASNPCVEYMHLDNSACNLASINLLKYLDEDGNFDIEGFKHTVDVMITAMDILIDRSSYPTAEITTNARAFRQLGLGYANLGASIMALGLPYDSDEGRMWAASVTALLTGEAYYQSAKLAASKGSFDGFKINREPMLGVIHKHWSELNTVTQTPTNKAIWEAADNAWGSNSIEGIKHGYRNSQATVIAPTGTIAFLMDCDTTGIEPDLALVKYKNMVGGGQIKIVNQTVTRALQKLSYTNEAITEVLEYIREHDTIEGTKKIHPNDFPVFDCSFVPQNGKRSIAPSGHYKMMGAVQPFVSGAISKTINLPKDATVADIREAYIESWKLGLKAVAVYRDGCKAIQPLRTEKDETILARATREVEQVDEVAAMPYRRKLPMDAHAIRHKFDITGHEGYIMVGLYEDGAPGEVFVKMNKEGSTISGLMDSFSIAISHGLQHGVPLDFLVRKFKHMRFEPYGFTPNQEIPHCTSVVDYLFRWMELRFAKFLPPKEEQFKVEVDSTIPPGEAHIGSIRVINIGDSSTSRVALARTPAIPRYVEVNGRVSGLDLDGAPICMDCGLPMMPSGACYRCMNCGTNSGCG